MFPGQDGQFGAPFEPPGGDFSGGAGGPPSADAMFESFLEGDDDLDLVPVRGSEERNDEVLAVGLLFFEKMKALR